MRGEGVPRLRFPGWRRRRAILIDKLLAAGPGLRYLGLGTQAGVEPGENIEKHCIFKLFVEKHWKRVNFKNIILLPYNGGFFEFKKNVIFININPVKDDPSIRINSLPAKGKNKITNKDWIGSVGKQVRFAKDIPYISV